MNTIPTIMGDFNNKDEDGYIRLDTVSSLRGLLRHKLEEGDIVFVVDKDVATLASIHIMGGLILAKPLNFVCS